MSIDLWCHLICLNFKIFKSVYDTVYENDGVKNGTKVGTYETSFILHIGLRCVNQNVALLDTWAFYLCRQQLQLSLTDEFMIEKEKQCEGWKMTNDESIKDIKNVVLEWNTI